jgi:hypothetical protein
MTKYFNLKSNQGVETVDELTLSDFPTRKDFYNECKRLRGEYSLAGMQVYTSSRSTKDWRNK